MQNMSLRFTKPHPMLPKLVIVIIAGIMLPLLWYGSALPCLAYNNLMGLRWLGLADDTTVTEQPVPEISQPNLPADVLCTEIGRYLVAMQLQLLGQTRNALASVADLKSPSLESITTIKQASLLEDLGDAQAAAVMWRKGPGAQLFIKEGWLRLEDGRMLEALDSFEQAAHIEPSNVGALLGLGYAAVANGDWTEAAAAFQRAVDLAPSNVEANYQLAAAALELRDFDFARKRAQLVLELEPNYGPAMILLGHSYRLEADFSQAAKWYAQVAATELGNTTANRLLAINSLEQGDAKEALTYMMGTTPPSTTQDRADWEYWLGRVYLELQQDAEASEHLQEAVRLMPETMLYRITLAQLLWDNNRKLEAIQELELVLQRSPGNEQAKSLLQQYRVSAHE